MVFTYTLPIIVIITFNHFYFLSTGGRKRPIKAGWRSGPSHNRNHTGGPILTINRISRLGRGELNLFGFIFLKDGDSVFVLDGIMGATTKVKRVISRLSTNILKALSSICFDCWSQGGDSQCAFWRPDAHGGDQGRPCQPPGPCQRLIRREKKEKGPTPKNTKK